jgi:hypothetical protein
MDRKKEAANKKTHDDRLLAESSLASRISPREKADDDCRLTVELPSVAIAQSSNALSGSSKKCAPEGSTSKRAAQAHAPTTAKSWETGLAKVVNPTDYDVLFGR